MKRPGAVGLGLFLLVLVGCAGGGLRTRIDSRVAWAATIDCLRRGGELRRIDRPAGEIVAVRRLSLEDRDFLERLVQPYPALPSESIDDQIEVRLGRLDDGHVPIEVRAFRVYRTPFGDFGRIPREEIAVEVLEAIEYEARARLDAKLFQEFLQRRRGETSRQIEGMVYIEMPRGRFTRGRDGYNKDEGPAHPVSLTPFYIDEYEVTVEQYARFLDGGGYRKKAYWSEPGWTWLLSTGIRAPAGWKGVTPENRRLPVQGVSWYEADAYARWAGKSLPTEAQWECAARGPVDFLWPWGTTFHDYCNHYGLELRRPRPVGADPRGVSLAGVHDLAGNVVEWVRDGYDGNAYRKGAPHVDPTGSSSSRYRVLRGGSYRSSLLELSTSYRDRAHPRQQDATFGFRCAVDLPSAEEPSKDGGGGKSSSRQELGKRTTP